MLYVLYFSVRFVLTLWFYTTTRMMILNFYKDTNLLRKLKRFILWNSYALITLRMSYSEINYIFIRSCRIPYRCALILDITYVILLCHSLAPLCYLCHYILRWVFISPFFFSIYYFISNLRGRIHCTIFIRDKVSNSFTLLKLPHCHVKVPCLSWTVNWQ